MIVYREQHHQADPRRLLLELRSDLERLDFRASSSHEDVVDALIAGGVLESAVADAVFPEADGIDPVIRALRRANVALGHLLWHSWLGGPAEEDRWRSAALAFLRGLELHQLPESVQITTPEGYAYYAVYPESYLEAARRCHAALGAIDVVCIGLRSIGASLSAVVASVFEELGCRVQALTLRPRGHPFSRSPALTPELERFLSEQRGAHFLLIDEGPGISGSSLGGTAEMLTGWGVEDARIILFPSHATEGSHLRSPEARDHWGRHRQFTVSFEELWIDSGRLDFGAPAHLRHDLSAGAWRERLFDDQETYPAVQPQHERRKYLIQSEAGSTPTLFTFFGLGRGARSRLRRAELLSEAGFAPAPHRTVHGFMVRSFMPGVPVSRGEASPDLLHTVARYLDHLSREHRTEPSVPDGSLREMVALNVAEGLGEGWEERIDSRLPAAMESWSERPVALDGRMQAHEWIRTDSGYLKTDAFDHHDDHFFPGCQDIAWDLAGAAHELDLDNVARAYLVERYRSLSGDRTISSRLPHYSLAYLAFRLGYCRLAASVLGDAPDGSRFSAAADRYAGLLRRELCQSPGACWNV